MRPTFRTLKIDDARALQALVVEHVESLEAGLRILDERVLLGGGAVDLVALDGDGRLVLIAVALVADDAMMLRMLEAFAWSLEYPDAVGRLYAVSPAAVLPRVMFVSERFSDAFLRKVKHLQMPSIGCLEFRSLEVDGVAGLYFNPVDTPRTPPTAPAAAPAVAIPPAPSTAPSAPGAPRPTEARPGELLKGLRVPENLSSQWQQILKRAVDAPDPAKIRVVREYLQSEFPGCVLYDSYEHQRAAQMFRVQNGQGDLMHVAAVSDDFFEAEAEGDIRHVLERNRLARALRDAGPSSVLITAAGLRVTKG
jgi:hypothetical protein